MNNIITLAQLITRLAKITGTDPNTARRFLRTFFASIEESLLKNEDVEIKGVGTFRRSTDPNFGTESGVAFIPAKEFADEINAPFAAFEPEILADGVEFNDEPEVEIEPEPTPEPEPEPVAVPLMPVEPEPEPVMPVEEEPEVPAEPEREPVMQVEPETEAEPEPEELVEEPIVIPQAAPIPEDDEEESNTLSEEPEEDEVEEKRSSKIWIWAAIIILLAIGISYFAAIYEPGEDDGNNIEATENSEDGINDETPVFEEVSVEDIAAENSATQEVAAVASEPESPAATTADTKEKAKAEVKRDTVTQKRFLATMAREYYGKGAYWVYIYEANADKLRNPNTIPPGTEVIIPELSSFAAATEEETMRIAEQKLAEINKRYK